VNVALALFLAFAAPQDEATRVVERRFTTELELATERFSVTGSEGGATEEKAMPEQVRSQADEIEIVDTYLDDEDPPEAFERLYATVASAFDVGRPGAPRSRTVSAGLQGKTVTFEHERDGGYARRCDDPDARPVQLKRLRAELSLAPFLPPAAEDGEDPPASWDLPVSELGRLVSPVEAEVRRPRAKEESSKGGLNLAPAAFSVSLGGLVATAEGTLRATRLPLAEDEPLSSRARLEFQLAATHDGSATLLAGRAGEAADELRLLYRGSGTLAWDPATGAIELELEGEARLAESFRARLEANGATAEVTGELVMSGTFAFAGRESRGE
jgi:hypothetical protein